MKGVLKYSKVTKVFNSIQLYISNPYVSWQCGINENTNGLLREYLPKSKEIAIFNKLFSS